MPNFFPDQLSFSQFKKQLLNLQRLTGNQQLRDLLSEMGEAKFPKGLKVEIVDLKQEINLQFLTPLN